MEQKVIPIILNGKDSAERMKEITDRLETGIQQLFDSDRYKAYLTTMAKFHNYSFNNTLLIAMQGGQLVAGFNKWKDTFHRTVKKGEKGIKILAPAPYKVKQKMEKLDEQGKPILDKDGKPLTEEKTVQIPAFKVVSVFDVSQTEGAPLPSIAVNELSGSVQDYQDFFKALEQASPVPIGFEDIEGGAHGYFHLLDNRIAIQEGMSQLQTIELLLFLSLLDGSAVCRPQQFSADISKRTQDVYQYIIENPFTKDTIQDLACMFGLAESSLKRCFKSIAGTSIGTFVKTKRMEAAADMLVSEPTLSIGEIGSVAGYENQSKFSAAFKSVMGVTPQAYRHKYC